MNKSATRILWVEDNISDILLIKEAFREAGVRFRLKVVEDGVEAVNYLLRRGQYSHSRRPGLIILDLNLPKKSGREVIADIKADSSLREIPLVVLTSSNRDRDVLEGFNPERSRYLVKPLSFDAIVDMAKQIQSFLASVTDQEGQG
ncbi:MAG: response regulator [Phycisphaerae bacterium]|jgi:CheY-like chemotaxis protein